MPRRRSQLISALLLVTVVTAAGCDTAEERAEEHYQRGMALLEDGDADRAMIEFRNVFQLNGNHSAARSEYARLLVERGEIEEAIAQYLRLVEQDWQNVAGHRQLAELALGAGDLETGKTHADAAYELDPKDPAIRGLKAAVDFRSGARETAVAMAREVLAERPDDLPASMVLIAERLEADDNAAALALVETALGHAPEDKGLALAKLGVLERMGDNPAVGTQLREMATRFPEDAAIRQALIRWYVSEGDLDAAEAILRDEAAAAPEDAEAQLTLVQFLGELRGPAAARAELERLIGAAAEPRPFRRALAGLDFAEGRVDAAVAALEALIAGAEPSDDRRDTQVALAKIRAAQGDMPGSVALVDAVLAEDGSHVEALKLRARRLIDADQPEEAIQALRTALGQAPEDSEALTLMAAAHERDGAHELAGERLALAVEVSHRAAAESLRYAQFLMADERFDPAESVIVDALRFDSENRDLLLALGQVHLARHDWARADQVAGLLRSQEDPVAREMATALAADALRGQNRLGETIGLLQTLAGAGGSDAQTMAAVVEAYLQAGDPAGARGYLDGIIAENPDNLAARTMLASLMAFAGEFEPAAEAYRAIIADAPDYLPAHQALYGALAAQGNRDAAEAALEAGLAATGDAPELLFLKAGALEAKGDFEGAITIYEDLYARNSSSPVIANNLASLITTHRDDEASLGRAFAVARRLRGTVVPEFQDTYGWILSRRGDHAEALTYLEPAAKALSGTALVQFHLGVAQLRLEQRQAARASLERAIEIAGPDSTLPQIAEARTLIDQLEAGQATGE